MLKIFKRHLVMLTTQKIKFKKLMLKKFRRYLVMVFIWEISNLILKNFRDNEQFTQLLESY